MSGQLCRLVRLYAQPPDDFGGVSNDLTLSPSVEATPIVLQNTEVGFVATFKQGQRGPVLEVDVDPFHGSLQGGLNGAR